MQQQQHYYESLKFHLLVSISKTTKLLLASSVPAVKPNLPTICEEVQWMNLHTNSCYLQIIPIFKIKKKINNFQTHQNSTNFYNKKQSIIRDPYVHISSRTLRSSVSSQK